MVNNQAVTKIYLLGLSDSINSSNIVI